MADDLIIQRIESFRHRQQLLAERRNRGYTLYRASSRRARRAPQPIRGHRYTVAVPVAEAIHPQSGIAVQCNITSARFRLAIAPLVQNLRWRAGTNPPLSFNSGLACFVRCCWGDRGAWIDRAVRQIIGGFRFREADHQGNGQRCRQQI